MKCREAQYWLYSFQPNAAWPADVVGHLQKCSECQQVQSQLRQIDQGVKQLTMLPGNDGPVAQVLQRVEQTPQTQVDQAAPRLRDGLEGLAALLLRHPIALAKQHLGEADAARHRIADLVGDGGEELRFEPVRSIEARSNRLSVARRRSCNHGRPRVDDAEAVRRSRLARLYRGGHPGSRERAA